MNFPQELWGMKSHKGNPQLVLAQDDFINTRNHRVEPPHIEFHLPEVKYEKDEEGDVYVKFFVYENKKTNTKHDVFVRLHSKEVYKLSLEKGEEVCIYKEV